MDSHDPNEQLLQAVRAENLSLVDQLLEHPDLDLNYRTGRGLTMLFEAVFCKEIFVRLLNRGYSIEGRDNDGRTLLRIAVWCYPAEIVHELIKRGADINAYDNNNHPPLSYAADKSLEIVCMLMYYEADVIRDSHALLWTFLRDCHNAAKILLRHTDLELSDLSFMKTCGNTTLYQATECRSPIALEILSIVDIKNERCEDLLKLALQYDTAEVFKKMWNLFGDLVVMKPSLIRRFFDTDLSGRSFSNKEWLEMLNLILNSPHIKNIYEPSFINQLNKNRFMHEILDCLSRRNIEPETRLDIITFFVSLGVLIDEYNLNYVYKYFSFKDELRFLIFTYNFEQEVKPRRLHHQLRTLFTLEITRHIVYEHFVSDQAKVLLNPMGYFAIPQNYRSLMFERVRYYNRTYTDWMESLKHIPVVPSLVEASRNEVMRAAKEIHNITKAYQYLEFVEKSNLPPLIKDMLLLKIKIY